MPPLGREFNGKNQHVHYIFIDDASKFATFYGKRLPTPEGWKTTLGISSNNSLLFGDADPYNYGNLYGQNGGDR